MWIRDALPFSIPGLRTITYGYESSLVQSNSFQSISDIAQTLVLQLKLGGWNLPSSKPVVFLAHSLGGLVLKEGIVQMAARDKSFSAVLDNISGAVMFGVPSLGMQQCHLMAMVEGQPNECLIEDLSRQTGARYLRDLNARFEGLSFLKTAKVFWAYETRESPTVMKRDGNTWARTGPPAVLVSPESATCHYYRKNKAATFPINEDHSNMVKFSRGDPNLEVVTQFIRELGAVESLSRSSTSVDVESQLGLSTQTDRLFPQAQGVDMDEMHEERRDMQALKELGVLLHSIKDVHRQLYSSELDLRFQQIEDPFQDTFEWAFHLPVLTDWLQQRFDSKLFWVHGKPGSGKSTFMKFLFQNPRTWQLLHDWRTDAREIRAGFFFHYRGSAIQKSFEGVLRSLITQVLLPHSDSYQELHQETWNQYQRANRQYDHFKDLIKMEEAILLRVQERIKNLNATITAGGSGDFDFDGEARVENLKVLQDALKDLQAEELGCHSALEGAIDSLRSTKMDIRDLARRCREQDHLPTRLFLTQIAADFERRDLRLIPKLERVVRRILSQETIEMDLILFFDALDEFDGHPNVISQFMKDLVQSAPLSKTRVKICLSSRPWKALQDQFAAHPQLALEMHNKGDIEDYVTRSVRGWSNMELFAQRLVSAILTRANGVFLWVRLAVRVLSESRTLAIGGTPTTLEQLEARLRQLPDDLLEFYRLVIERIGRSNRRRTFALLELLARHNPHGPPVTAAQIREAVLVSECTDCLEAEEVRETARATNTPEQARTDLAAWGGGLVEIKRDRPQLMHQTVLEFVMGPDFKRIVVGDHLADFVSENGHSFYVKYWASRHNWDTLSVATVKKELSIKNFGPTHLYSDFGDDAHDFVEIQHLAYHCERAEATTGNSQFEYLDSLSLLQQNCSAIDRRGSKMVFLLALVSCGLTLGTRDWIERNVNSGEQERLTSGPFEIIDFPLFSSTFFAPILSGFHDGHLKIFSLLLDNDFPVRADRHFFPLLCSALWDSEFRRGPRLGIEQSILLKAAGLVLRHGQDPNANIELVVFEGSPEVLLEAKFIHASALHVCLPALAKQVLQHDGDPNCLDEHGRTALDWLLDFPAGMRRPKAWNCQRTYDMCKILIEAGGVISQHTRKETCLESLAELEEEGYDIRVFYEKLGVKEWPEASHAISPAGVAKRKRVDSFESGHPAPSDDG
ncbi:hypothetical protein B0T16DRAFT_227181 [Cercophora newfieldiana]|uniref:Nephrocystin 3-like N-terminal domain-containing protein n=1 Tax=Cercophora newfieldiana TaxID=92897 RepID=A0AA39XQX8_9PEZI|nr:hypothetical protein B0T16DRAFT_227181 [Cercophora newfieldiana]